MTPSIKETVERLDANTRLQMEWEKWELGDGPAPAPLFCKDTAAIQMECRALIERLAGALEEIRKKSVWADVSAIPRVNEIARRALSGEPTP